MNSSELRLTVYSPERRLLNGSVIRDLSLPTREGTIQILPGHTAMMGVIEPGVLRYRLASGSEPQEGLITTGFFQVKDNEVKILAETLELKGEIDVERAKRAQKRAEKNLQESGLDEATFRKYQLKLERALIRQQLARRG